MGELIEVYKDVKAPRQGSGQKLSDHTRSIQRIIRGINLFFDPNAYETDEEADGENVSKNSRRTIISVRKDDTTYYHYCGCPEGADKALDWDETLIAAINPEMRNLLKQQQQGEMRKILGDFLSKSAERGALWSDLERFIYYADPHSSEPEAFQDKICQLVKAMRNNQQIRFDYRGNEEGSLKTKELAPYGLVHRNENWYLYGKDLGDGHKKIFQVSNIQKLALDTVNFSWPNRFNLIAEFQQLWGVFNSDKPVEQVRLQVSKAKAYRFKVMQYHPSQQNKELPDGSLELTLQLRHPNAMIPWLLSWGGEVIPLEPASLRDSMKQQLRGMLEILE